MTNLKRAIHGLRIIWSPINAAYFLMWHDTVLQVGSKADMIWERDILLRDVKTS